MNKITALTLLVAACAPAQTMPDAGPAVGQAMKENAEALRQYSFKRRTEITVKGRSRSRLDLIRYVNGKMETVPLETPTSQGQPPAGRGLRGMIAQKKIAEKKEEMREDAEKLTSLLRQYSSLHSDSPHSLLEKATISRTGEGPSGQVKILATGLIRPKDSFTLIWSPAEHRPQSVEIQSDLEGKPILMKVEFQRLPGGPYYAAHTTISQPKKDLLIVVDAFDYERSGDAGRR